MFEPVRKAFEVGGQKLVVSAMNRRDATLYRARIMAAGKDDAKMDEALAWLVMTCLTLPAGSRVFQSENAVLDLDHRIFTKLIEVCMAANSPEGEQSPDPMPPPPPLP